jgi:hypothetical protein
MVVADRSAVELLNAMFRPLMEQLVMVMELGVMMSISG